ncbi:hypothetical protein ACJ2A9_00610 [Anaerobacillus sp. MEB173]|uniref:hypothetical protein n=1 Tax=Anaerobacillus sp. MEB173 TaxID=3383345 RepID=UPI003F92E943
MSLIDYEDFYRICCDWKTDVMTEKIIVTHYKTNIMANKVPNQTPMHLNYIEEIAENEAKNDNKDILLV